MASKVPKHPPEFCCNLATRHEAFGAIRNSRGLVGPLGAFGGHRGPPGASWNLLEPLRAFLEPPGASSRASWGLLGPCLAFLGTPVGKRNLAAQRGGHNGDRKSVGKTPEVRR
jgi:hypothetical protein